MALGFEKVAADGNAFIAEIAVALETTDQEKAGRILRSVLRALRNRLTVEESFEFIDQLPLAVKAVYVEGWKVKLNPSKLKHIEDFRKEVYNEDELSAANDFDHDGAVNEAVKAVFQVLSKYIDAAQIDNVMDAIPAALYGSPDLKIYVPQGVMKAYIRALGGFSVAATSNNGVDNKGTQWYNGQGLTFDGIPLFVANGLAANTAIAAETSNLFFGCGLLNDQNEVKVIDMSPLDGSQNVRFVLRAGMAVNYHSVSDIVTYNIPNSAN